MATQAGKMDPSCLPGIARFDPAQEKRNYSERDFWTMSAIESQKAAEDSQNKENINDSRGFIGSQKQLVFFSLSRNKQVSIFNKATILFL